MDFNKLNTALYQLSAPHRFAKKPNKFDAGYLKMSDWLNDLCYYYEKRRQTQENTDESEFKSFVDNYRKKVNALEDSEYKRGLLKALDEI